MTKRLWELRWWRGVHVLPNGRRWRVYRDVGWLEIEANWSISHLSSEIIIESDLVKRDDSYVHGNSGSVYPRFGVSRKQLRREINGILERDARSLEAAELARIEAVRLDLQNQAATAYERQVRELRFSPITTVEGSHGTVPVGSIRYYPSSSSA